MLFLTGCWQSDVEPDWELRTRADGWSSGIVVLSAFGIEGAPSPSPTPTPNNVPRPSNCPVGCDNGTVGDPSHRRDCLACDRNGDGNREDPVPAFLVGGSALADAIERAVDKLGETPRPIEPERWAFLSMETAQEKAIANSVPLLVTLVGEEDSKNLDLTCDITEYCLQPILGKVVILVLPSQKPYGASKTALEAFKVKQPTALLYRSPKALDITKPDATYSGPQAVIDAFSDGG